MFSSWKKRSYLFAWVSNKVRYDIIPSIFHLGDTIYMTGADRPLKPDPEMLLQRNDQRLWRLYHTGQTCPSTDLKCYALDHNGETYVCIKRKIDIALFDGEQEISSLPAFPLRYAENSEHILEGCRAQGQHFLECLDTRLLSHNGWAIGSGSEGVSNSPLQYVTGDVVVDMVDALKAHPDWRPVWKFPKVRVQHELGNISYLYEWSAKRENTVSCDIVSGECMEYDACVQKVEYCTNVDPFLSSWFCDQIKDYTPQGHDLELLPRRVFAYALEDRRFVAVDPRNLRPVEDHWKRSPVLIINQAHSNMLHALVDSHFKQKEIHDMLGVHSIHQDTISNKGKGLVILLYGVPGVGKASTAESIAHSWNKRLLLITCGDLGTQPGQVEGSLKEIFRLAQLWDCILLLDEADVFLTERSPAALERNALVSVFLRMLEYYSGILFLTTNLPGSIDEAFKSRIHISLYYPHLDKDTTLKIWDMNLSRLAEIEKEHAQTQQQLALAIDVKGIRRFAKKHYRSNEDGKGRWNGRQIRNAFLIAAALARFEKNHPQRAAYAVVADASLGFERYLLETRGRTAGENAFQRGLRADFILETPEKFEGTPAVQVPILATMVVISSTPSETPLLPHQTNTEAAAAAQDQLTTPGLATLPTITGPIITETSTLDTTGMGEMLSPDQNIDAQQGQGHRTSVGRGMAPSGKDTRRQGSPMPWGAHGQPPQRGVSHSHVDEDTDDDSDDS
ncbi:hypothetical protein BJX68DRAFT_270501 [Aspergillus pseudodeflectus]|uniref:AAA+ ATPase domain-containing protein n=1 Tax=Aspergillus pseudodeflectus TaxID=176178 RepID=A0ABR4JS49_9EURO